MIASKRRRPGPRTTVNATRRRTVGLKAYLVHVEGYGMSAVFGVVCKPDDDPGEVVKAVQELGGVSGLTFEVIPAEGLCVPLAGDVSARETRP